MIIQEIQASNCTPQTIVIGRRGTYDTMQIAFDLSFLIENYGSGTAVLAVKRSRDESAYPAVVTQEDATLLWTVNEIDTAYVGSGECQLMWYVDGGLAKTIIYPMVVMRDILQTAKDPPDGYENWIEHLTELGAETQQNAQNAAQSASEAKESEESAAESAQRAEDAAGMLVDVSATATTLEPGQPATAEYDEGVFKFGIPKGDKLTYADLTEADKEDLVQGPIKAAQDAAVDAVGTAKTNAVDAVNGAGTTQVQNVNSAGSTQVNTVNQAGATQVGNVNQAGATQVQAIEDKGDEVIDSIPSDYSDLTAEVDDLTRHLSDLEDTVTDSTTGLDTKAPVILETASGAIASFSDGADSMPIKKLVAQIEPVQDLHGYENPWPGGGGANQWDEQWELGTIDPNTGADKPGTANIRSKHYIPVLPDASYYFKTGTNFTILIFYYDANKDLIRYQYISNTAAIMPSNCYYLKFNAGVDYGTTYNNDIAINYPSTVTTYSPYSNICPISGWTGAEIEQSGVNLFPDTSDAFRILGTSVYAYRDLQLPSGTHLYLTVEDNDTSVVVPADTSVGFISKDTQGKNLQKDQFTWIVQNGNITTRHKNNPINGNTSIWLGSILTYPNDQENIAKILKRWKFTLNIGDAATPHEPYTGNQISVNWEDEAGTIYGGEDEVISGKLKKTMGIVDLGTLDWRYESGLKRFLPVNDVQIAKKVRNDTVVAHAFCSAYKVDAVYLTATEGYDNIIGITDGGKVRIKDMAYTDPVAFKAALNGVQFVYDLIEPIEYTLTANELTTLYGTNNIWASTGDTSVEYCADTKLYIDGITAPDEDMIANSNIASGKYFVVNNQLYLSTAAIAAGASIVPGTNCTATNLAEALNALNS